MAAGRPRDPRPCADCGAGPPPVGGDGRGRFFASRRPRLCGRCYKRRKHHAEYAHKHPDARDPRCRRCGGAEAPFYRRRPPALCAACCGELRLAGVSLAKMDRGIYA